jgi:hypothetical protein
MKPFICPHCHFTEKVVHDLDLIAQPTGVVCPTLTCRRVYRFVDGQYVEETPEA